VSEQETCEKFCCSELAASGDFAAIPFVQNICKKSSYSEKKLPRVFFAAEEFVALDRGDNADGTFVARLGPLDAAKAAHAHRTRQGNFVGQSQKNFNGRAFAYVFGQKEVDTAGTDVAGFGAGLANRCARSPTDGERQPHLEALGSAAFGTGQGIPPD
jgi:hypothetical protein